MDNNTTGTVDPNINPDLFAPTGSVPTLSPSSVSSHLIDITPGTQESSDQATTSNNVPPVNLDTVPAGTHLSDMAFSETIPTPEPASIQEPTPLTITSATPTISTPTISTPTPEPPASPVSPLVTPANPLSEDPNLVITID